MKKVTFKLQADTISGVYEVEEFDEDQVSEEIFYSSLRTLTDGDIICAEVSAYMYEKIKSEYGIN